MAVIPPLMSTVGFTIQNIVFLVSGSIRIILFVSPVISSSFGHPGENTGRN
jgi:hypothetical protein